MNKLVVIGITLLLVIGGGVFYRRVFLAGGKICGSNQGEAVTWEMRSKENKWQFDPAVLEVKKCDKITLNIYNEDAYDHGFAIDVFGVSQRLSPHAPTTVTFTASQPGEHTFYCSVPCGEGHFEQKGKIVVGE